MQRHNVKDYAYSAGKSSTSRALMYQHMSNHYRRILNAKKEVDSSPPECYKPRRSRASSSPAGSPEKFLSRNSSPVLTESISNSSYGGFCWDVESCASKKLSRRSRCRESTRGTSSPGNADVKLIDEIAFDTKNGPSAYYGISCEDNMKKNKIRYSYDIKKMRTNESPIANSKRRSLNKSKFCHQKKIFIIKEKTPPDVMDKHSDFFASYSSEFYPRILKSEAESKVKNLRVYHPPRRKANIERASWMENEDSSRTPINCTVSSSTCKCEEICICGRKRTATECKFKSQETIKEQSQTSSRDSAYNGGVSSLPESRSPTPDQRGKTEGCRCESKDGEFYDNAEPEPLTSVKPRLFDPENRKKDEEEIKDRRSRKYGGTISPKFANQADEVEGLKKRTNDVMQSIKKIKEDALYIKLIEDITSEVLEKGLYTNKALGKVMKRHIAANSEKLDKDRMLKEIDHLRIQLDVPEDEGLLDLQLEATENFVDLRKCRSVVSDSDFKTPDRSVEKRKNDDGRRNDFARSYGRTSRDYYSKKKNETEDEKSIEAGKKTVRGSFREVLEDGKTDETKARGEISNSGSDENDDESVSILHLNEILNGDKNKDEFVKSDSYSNEESSGDESEDFLDEKAKRKQSIIQFRTYERSSSEDDETVVSKPRKHEEKRRNTRKKLTETKMDSSDDESVDSNVKKRNVSFYNKDIVQDENNKKSSTPVTSTPVKISTPGHDINSSHDVNSGTD